MGWNLAQIVLNLMGKKLMDLPPAAELEGIYRAFHDFVGAMLVFPFNIPGTAYSRGFKVYAPLQLLLLLVFSFLYALSK